MLNESAEGAGVELVAGDLALELPGVSVGGEDAVAEEVPDGAAESGAFAVAGEVGLENVLDHGRVRCEYLAGAEGAVEDEGGGRADAEDVGDPVNAAVAVCSDLKDGADDGVRFGNGRLWCGFGI